MYTDDNAIIIRIPQMEVIYKDVFHMKWLYRVVKDWLELESWSDATEFDVNGTKGLFMEALYLERRLKAKDWRIWWRLYKKINNYYRYRLNINWIVLMATDVEIMHEGRKIKCQTAEITIKIEPVIEVDWKNEWENHWILKYFHNWFRERVFYKEMDKHKIELWRDAYRLQGMIKKYLETKTFLPDMEIFNEKFDEM